MKILHINTTDTGGSGILARTLSKELNKQGVNSKVLVLDKNLENDDDVIPYFNPSSSKLNKINALIKRNLLASYYQWKIQGLNKTGEMFTFPKSLIDITKHPLYMESDIIHLHQTYDFVNIPTFFSKNKKPIVWTFHDMNPFSGGYHLINNSITNSPKIDEISIKNIEVKKKAYKYINNLKIICPSQSLLDYLNQSELFSNSKKYVIPNGINRDMFKNFDKTISRKVFTLPLKKKIILFISDDHKRVNKGGQFFEKIYEKFKNDYIFAIAGKNFHHYNNKPNIILLGYIQDERLLPLLYSACDLNIVPSLFESFSLVTLESIACGTPVIAFDNSGPAEIITHKKNGYLARLNDLNDFCFGIDYYLKEGNIQTQTEEIIASSSKFDIRDVASKYINVYRV